MENVAENLQEMGADKGRSVYVGLSIIWGLIEKSTLEKLDRSNNMASVLL